MKKILVVALLAASLNLLGLSKQHLESLVSHAQSLVTDASKAKGYDQKKKYLDEAHSVMSALTSHIGYVNEQYSNVLSILHEHGESVDKFNSDQSYIASKISNLDKELKVQAEQLDKARKYETAAGVKSMHTGNAANDAQIAARLRKHYAKSKSAARKRARDNKTVQNSMDAEDKISAASRAWPSSEAFVKPAQEKRKKDVSALKSKFDSEHDQHASSVKAAFA